MDSSVEGDFRRCDGGRLSKDCSPSPDFGAPVLRNSRIKASAEVRPADPMRCCTAMSPSSGVRGELQLRPWEQRSQLVQQGALTDHRWRGVVWVETAVDQTDQRLCRHQDLWLVSRLYGGEAHLFGFDRHDK